MSKSNIPHETRTDSANKLNREPTYLELDTWIKSDRSYVDRRETDLELNRNEGILDFVEFLKSDKYVGDISKLKITPLRETNENNEGKPEVEEVDCGEPFREQHFYIDFTPIPGIDDDEELIKKNVDFWNFVNSNEEMQKIMNSGIEEVPRLEIPSVSSTNQSEEIGGVYWLQKEEVADLAATSKLQQEYCDDNNDVYFSEDDVVKKSQKEFEKFKAALKVTKLPRRSNSYDIKTDGTSKINLEKLKKDMIEFDSKNPKSFEPPTNPRIVLESARALSGTRCTEMKTYKEK